MNTIFDIETAPLPDAELASVMPQFDAPANYKDPKKIAEYICESREMWRRNAALSALTGRVLAIGLRRGTESTVWGVDNEADMLTLFWDRWDQTTITAGDSKFVGFCCKSFDLPFLVQRSWIHGLSLPFDLFAGRYFSPRVIDLQERWLCFSRDTKGCSLDAVARALKVGQKNGNGKDFAMLWNTDRDRAIDYLKNDLTLTAAVAARLGL